MVRKVFISLDSMKEMICLVNKDGKLKCPSSWDEFLLNGFIITGEDYLSSKGCRYPYIFILFLLKLETQELLRIFFILGVCIKG